MRISHGFLRRALERRVGGALVGACALLACGGDASEGATDNDGALGAAAGSAALAPSSSGSSVATSEPAQAAAASPASGSPVADEVGAAAAASESPSSTVNSGAPAAAGSGVMSSADAADIGGASMSGVPSGAATSGAAMEGGVAAMDGAASTGTDESGDAIIRGDDPTDTTGLSAGPYEVAKYTSGFEDKPGFLAGTVYYPSDAEPPFAYVVFCPGFVSYQTSIQDWGPFLASHGIVIMTIDTNTSSDSVVTRRTALKDALASLQFENERSDSPLKGKLEMSRYGLMGWSMGGGASLLNASEDPGYKSVVTVAEHLATAPGTNGPLSGLRVPTLMFAGTADTAILGLGMSQPAYERIPETTSKLLYEVQSADHFFFNTPSALEGVVGRYALAWQKVFLEGDLRYKSILLAEGPRASDFRSNLQ